MKHKKIIKHLTILLILAFGITLILPALSSCTATEQDDAETIGENNSSESENENKDESKEEAETTTPEPTTSEPIQIEILTPPEIADDSVTANIKDITSGVVFEPNFRRGINMGNMLEAPDEGAWGVTFDPKFFSDIKARGFDFVRLPVGWGNHLVLKGDSIYIDKHFMDRVKYIVDEALKNDLGIIINIHHYSDMDENPDKYYERLYQIWRILSESYQNYPANVAFEIFNEPHGELNTQKWIQYQNECIKIIRETNQTRKIVVSAGDYGGIGGINELIIPEDENLILSFHYYDPFNFTHQGADWADNMEQHLGTEWTGSDFEKKNIENSFKTVKAWSEASGLPVLLGEFGAYSKADMESRVRWTEYMRETAEYYGFAWSYWEYCSGFGIYDQETEEFFEGLVNALTGTPINESVYATGTGSPKITMIREGGYFGPFTVERNINLVCDTWTGMSLSDTDDGTQIIELNENSTMDWAQAFIILDGLTDTGDAFSHDILELTIRNIDGSITDFCFNLDNGDSVETNLVWLSEKQLKGDTAVQHHEIKQNDDGTVTFVFDLQRAYKALSGKCENMIRLKMFIESVPDRNKNYDRNGSVEFISAELK